MRSTYDRIFNFSAGPAALPLPVLEQAKEELINYRGTGMSVMEMSHRSEPFEQIIHEAEQDLRSLLSVPASHHVLFLQGGASLQFSMAPMNFLGEGKRAEYVVTGSWGKKALESAKIEGSATAIFDSEKGGYRTVPDLEGLTPGVAASYAHITTNETIQGVEFPDDPSWSTPVIADMSSDILSREVAVQNYALIYAGAQKNMGPAGLTVVIISDDFLGRSVKKLSPMLDYKVHAKNSSLYNTPAVWSIYVSGLVYKHLLKSGGVQASAKAREEKAGLIYGAIDRSEGFYHGHAERNSRSRMNVTFTLRDASLTTAFISEAEKMDLMGLPGHRSVGGCRASIYDAFPVEGCRLLAQHMQSFAKAHG